MDFSHGELLLLFHGMAQLELAFSFSGIAHASFFMIILDFVHMALLLSLKLLSRCNAVFLVFGLACLSSMLSLLNHVVSSIQTSPRSLTCPKFSSFILDPTHLGLPVSLRGFSCSESMALFMEFLHLDTPLFCRSVNRFESLALTFGIAHIDVFTSLLNRQFTGSMMLLRLFARMSAFLSIFGLA